MRHTCSLECLRKLYKNSSVQSLSCVWLFVTPWIAAHQASLSINNSRSLLKLMAIESVMPSSYLILCHPLLLFPPIYRFDKYLKTCIHQYCIIQNIFSSVLHLLIPLLSPSNLRLHWYFYFLHSFVFSRMFYDLKNIDGFSNWHLGNLHLKFLHVFSWLDSPFILNID